MSSQHVGDLEISQDMEFQRRSWTVERVGWVLMLLFVVAAALGLFGGGGPFSDITTGSETDDLQIQHPRFAREGRPMSLSIQAQPAEGQGSLRLHFDEAYIAYFQMDQIMPVPSQVEAGGGQIIYVFALANAGDRITIMFDMTPEYSGLVSGQIGIEGSPAFTINHFIYP